MTKYVRLALLFVGLSLAMAVLVLLGLYGFNPLNLSIVDTLTNATTPADEAAGVSAVTGISVAVSTLFALVLGVIAIIVLIESERSETRAVEQLKLDVASLASTLRLVRDRALLYTQTDAVNWSLDPFSAEREALSKILTSSTGWALYSWGHQKDNKKFTGLFAGFAGLVDLTTLDLERFAQPILNRLVERSSKLFEEVTSIEEEDFKRMAGALSHLSDGFSAARIAEVRSGDILDGFVEEKVAADASSYRAPTEDELKRLIERADRVIGGEAGKTIDTFGRLAIEGSDKDRENFHRLISQVLSVDLDNF